MKNPSTIFSADEIIDLTRDELKEVYKDRGRFLECMQFCNGMSAGNIAKKMGIGYNHIFPLIDYWEKKGFIERKGKKNTRKVYLTPLGVEAVEIIADFSFMLKYKKKRRGKNIIIVNLQEIKIQKGQEEGKKE